MGLLRGFSAPYQGLLFVARHGLWMYLVLPLVLNVALVAGAITLGVRLARRAWLGDSLAVAAEVGINAGIYVGAAALALLIFIVLQPIFAAPFIDLLTERAEKIVRGGAPSAGILRSLWQALLHGSLKALLYLFALVITLVLGAFTGVGGLLGAAAYGLFLAFDGFDYPLARRAVSFSGKWRYLASHPAQTLGYCCGAGLLYLVPLAALVAPAFAAVGATLAYLHTEAERPNANAELAAVPAPGDAQGRRNR